MPTARKFQTGKTAKKISKQIAAYKEQMEQITNLQESTESNKTNEILEQYKEKRGKSLMEEHLEKRRQKKVDQTKSKERRPFDREKVK